MIKVHSLHIYPIKGMMGSSVTSAKVLERGFEHDRRYMLIDKNGTFISQRKHPQLVFFQPQIVNDSLIIKNKNRSINIPLYSTLENTIETTIFEHVVPATEVSHDANSWFSSILEEDVRLVKMTKKDIRHKDLIKGPKRVEVSFADGYPYQIAGTASINKLNTLLERPIGLDRFRPNIVVETTVPHIEDSWEDIKIGKAELLVIKSCARCPVSTVDQILGIKSKEPLKTLATYRKKENKVYFGANAISRRDSHIDIGDTVVVL